MRTSREHRGRLTAELERAAAELERAASTMEALDDTLAAHRRRVRAIAIIAAVLAIPVLVAATVAATGWLR